MSGATDSAEPTEGADTTDSVGVFERLGVTERIDLTDWAFFHPVLLLVYAIMLLPIVIVVLTSFTVHSAPTIPYDGVTLDWYVQLAGNSRIINALVVSTIAATLSAVLAGFIGTVTAFGFVRSELPYEEELATFLLLPLMISPVITGFAINRYAGALNIPRGYPAIVLAHSVLALPYVFLIVRSQLMTFDNRLEDASRIMGAGKLETVINVTLPNIAPGIIAGMLLAFIISFGEFTATQFLVTVQTTTIPVILFTMIGTGMTPVISALATVLVAILIVLGLTSEVLS